MKKLILIILISTLTSCSGYNFYDILASLGAESPNLARSISFTDTDYDADQITGTLKFSPALSEKNITEYRLYWGSSPTTKISQILTPVFTPNGSEQTYTFPADFPVPVGATHFLICSVNGTNEMSVCASLDIPDLVVEMFANINPNLPPPPPAIDSSPTGFTEIDGLLYFGADDGIGYAELWSTDGIDGTVAHTKKVFPGITMSGAWNNKLIKIGSLIYFRAFHTTYGDELWVYDSTLGYLIGTNPKCLDIQPYSSVIDPSSPGQPAILKGKIYFSATELGDTELYEYDPALGYIAGTNPQKIDINTTGNSSPDFLTAYNEKLYFSASDGVVIRLYELDPDFLSNPLDSAPFDETTNPRVIDINSSASSNPIQFAVYNNKLYFQASQAATGNELWVLDSTLSIASPYNALPTSNPKLIDIIPGAVGSVPQGMMVLNNKLIFAADDIIHGRELWTSDGTAAGTYLIRDLTTGAAPSVFSAYVYGSYENYFIFNDKLFMNLNVSGDTELVITDGIYSGTSFNNIFTGPGNSSNPKYFTSLNGLVYFVADDGLGMQIWSTDGTSSGTIKRTDIAGLAPKELYSYNGKIFFQGTDAANGTELWELYYK